MPTDEERKQVLAAYQPEMRFPRGERFFPMDARAYMDASALRLHKNRGLDRWRFSQEERAKLLQGEQNTPPVPHHRLYLQFIHELGISAAARMILVVLIMALVGLLAYAFQSAQIGAFGVFDCPRVQSDCLALDQLNIKIGMLALLIGWSVAFQYNRKVALGLIINAFGWLFFADPQLVDLGFGLLALVMAAGFLTYYALEHNANRLARQRLDAWGRLDILRRILSQRFVFIALLGLVLLWAVPRLIPILPLDLPTTRMFELIFVVGLLSQVIWFATSDLITWTVNNEDQGELFGNIAVLAYFISLIVATAAGWLGSYDRVMLWLLLGIGAIGLVMQRQGVRDLLGRFRFRFYLIGSYLLSLVVFFQKAAVGELFAALADFPLAALRTVLTAGLLLLPDATLLALPLAGSLGPDTDFLRHLRQFGGSIDRTPVDMLLVLGSLALPLLLEIWPYLQRESAAQVRSIGRASVEAVRTLSKAVPSIVQTALIPDQQSRKTRADTVFGGLREYFDQLDFEPELHEKKTVIQRYEENTGLDFDLEIKPLMVLFVALHAVVLVHLSGPVLLSPLLPAHLVRASIFALQIILAASAGFWYFIDPLPLSRTDDPTAAGKIRYFFGLTLAASLIWLTGSVVVILLRGFYPALLEALLPWIRLVVLVPILGITLVLLGSRVIGFLIDSRSVQPDTLPGRAKSKYEKILRQRPLGEPRCAYHARVVEETVEGQPWTILMYNYFYAFNDWRSAVGGYNNHEGDWEAVAVYLRADLAGLIAAASGTGDSGLPAPVGAALSQHHEGVFKLWGDLHKNGRRPIIYVARGSHANYSRPDIYPTALFFEGWSRRLITGFDGLVRRARGAVGFQEQGLPTELAEGDGEPVKEWKAILTDDCQPGWMQYRGLWGANVGMENESGPPGPRWDRTDETRVLSDRECEKRALLPCNEHLSQPRSRWDLIRWKNALLLETIGKKSLDPDERRRAVRELAHGEEELAG